MSNDPPREHSSEPSPALDELLLQLESLKQSNNIAAYISLLQQILLRFVAYCGKKILTIVR